MILEITIPDLEIIKNEARKSYPQECCGLLIGKTDNDRKIITQVIPQRNDWENQKDLFSTLNDRNDRNCRDTFSIDPLAILQVQKQIRDQNLAIIGIYHSHPDHPAVPSAFDREFAWHTYSYIIASVNNGDVTRIRSWILDSDRNFQEEVITQNT